MDVSASRMPESSASRSSRRRIDVHHHFLSPSYVASWGEEKLGSISAAGRVARWSVDLSLELMAVAGVETAITSVSSPGWPPGPPETVAATCRAANETGARLVADYAGNFGMFGNLPLPSIDLALDEITYCFDVLRADGVALFTNYAGLYIGDAVFDPIFEELSRRSAVVFVHPITPPGGKSLEVVSESTLDYPFETTRAIVNLLFNGTAERFPGIRFIFSHAGGAIPYLAGRVSTFSELNPKFKQRGFERVMPALSSFWYDITQSANAATFAALRTIAPPNKLLFGTDVPFARKEQIGLTVRNLGSLGLSDMHLDAINRENALALFPRLEDVMST